MKEIGLAQKGTTDRFRVYYQILKDASSRKVLNVPEFSKDSGPLLLAARD